MTARDIPMTPAAAQNGTISLPSGGSSAPHASEFVSHHKEKIMVRKGSWIAVIVAIVTACSVGVRTHAHAAGDVLQEGAPAPAFSLPSQEDTQVSLSQFKGKWVVLYFYPKDMTSGCTIEAHNFQRDLSKYDALNAVVLGVSLDTVESHKTFCTKDSLTFKLLADPDHKVIDAYGVPLMAHGDMKFASRDTFLISPQAKIVKVWTGVNPNTHSDDVLAAIAGMNGNDKVQSVSMK
jgi:thioredoxin-dependent peroxiredoxin